MWQLGKYLQAFLGYGQLQAEQLQPCEVDFRQWVCLQQSIPLMESCWHDTCKAPAQASDAVLDGRRCSAQEVVLCLVPCCFVEVCV